ncbi:NADH:ubiquinone reductase (Na(+)-transporting) subunit B [Deferribacterales bacterium Es71-Z0220]|jgi:Na+-transporting NADH:ubiquinone oxidoreductase subunit B|uniref:NADH:ubiquinone reductase (Na(+)-transporting) subunit B n=1 Tax=Deferrivibrio essentukiensis TaxID=2880922 RepID=UPI001F617C6C|nr:NADH:ubiquinone reductase (Na(+)-transporting) subunit B [Deferrivibrio essentukiensis]MBZ4672134.1 NADH:ubiquinone oxidoreductase, subunit [Deferribacteraceae bacterium]MCB4204334.1 NADH:ubiquinone reductase (Na(+)-transporting) subunit B [Deferrivibrio essentukiensis]
MKKLTKFFAKVEKHFVKGGKFESLFPVFEMIDTFILTPLNRTKGKTHIRDGLDLKRVMTTVVIALIPCVIMALYNTGYQANLAYALDSSKTAIGFRHTLMELFNIPYDYKSISSNFFLGSLYFFPLYIITLIVGGTWELLFAVIRKHEIGEAFLVTSLLYPLILPPTVPLWEASVALSIGLVLGKEVFGGTGRNIVNPALFSRAILFFAYPASMSGDKVWIGLDSISKATPLAEMASAGKISYSLTDAFLGFIPGSMGETSTLACLFGAFVLIYTGIGSWRIILSSVIGLLGVSSIFYMIGSDTNHMFQLNPLIHLIVGGFAFGVVFMATDPVSASMTEKGKYYYGLLIGALTAIIRIVNPAYPEGVMLAILFANIMAPLIDHFVIESNIKRREKRYATRI